MKYTQQEESVIYEFGELEGRKIVEEHRAIAEHCKKHGITHHSINEDGTCNMGCC